MNTARLDWSADLPRRFLWRRCRLLHFTSKCLVQGVMRRRIVLRSRHFDSRSKLEFTLDHLENGLEQLLATAIPRNDRNESPLNVVELRVELIIEYDQTPRAALGHTDAKQVFDADGLDTPA